MKNLHKEDLKIFKDRKNEKTISFESLIKKLEENGKLKFSIYSHVRHGDRYKK